MHLSGKEATGNEVFGNRIGSNADGTQALANGIDGVYIHDAPHNLIGGTTPDDRNLISGNQRHGITIIGIEAQGNQVAGNYIGTTLDGMQRLPNANDGVHVDNAPENIIGGETAAHRNVISGNRENGIAILGANASRNRIQGNYIGTNKDGIGDQLGNGGDGVLVDGAAETTIGGLAPTVAGVADIGDAPGNVISGNRRSGIHIKGSAAKNGTIQGNMIGRDATGTKLANIHHGIFIEDASYTTIGEPATTRTPAANTGNSNVISGNKQNGIRIQGNDARGNQIRRNEIYDNGRIGIDLVGGKEALRKNKDGVTPNDDDDSDEGPNHLLNFPAAVTSFYDLSANKTYISGVVSTLAPALTVIDLYANTSVDPSGFGEGQYYLGSTMPNQDGAFYLTIDGPLAAPLLPNKAPFLGATATGAMTITGGLDPSTSEFSPVCGDPDHDGKVDSDGDGIPDDWERKGIDFNGDDVIDLNLTKLGAKWNRKDVFVEVDWMIGSFPQQTSFDAVKTAYRRALVLNPDNSLGIALHVDPISLGNPIPFSPEVAFEKTPASDFDFWEIKDLFFGTATEQTSPNRHNILGARSLVYHYNVIVDKVSGDAGGWGELLGDDFVNNKESDWEGDAVAFMHELGHNLGLNHGGPIDARAAAHAQSDFDYKPNQLSVMNYFYTYRSWAPGRPLDYSRYSETDLAVLNEQGLHELDGITGTRAPYGVEQWPVVYSYPKQNGKAAVTVQRKPAIGWIDWNKSGLSESLVFANINDEPGKSVTSNDKDVMQSREEWNSLRYDFRSERNFGGTLEAPGFEGIVALPDKEFIRSVAATLDYDGDGISNADDNVPFVFNPDQSDEDGDGIGDLGELASLSLSRQNVPGNTEMIGTVSLLLPAPEGGAEIELFTSEPWLVDLPYSVTVPAGQRSVAFTFRSTSEASAIIPATVYASYGVAVVETDLVVGPKLAQSDLGVSKTVISDPNDGGGKLTYTLTVTNQGPEPVIGVELVDTLPDNVALVSASGSAGVEQVPGPGAARSLRLHVRHERTSSTRRKRKTCLAEAGADS